MIKVNEITLGALLRQSRLSQGLSLRATATRAGIAPMYLSLLERDACGPPSDEKLQSLAEVLGEPHVETLFAKAGRVTPEVVSTILRHPTQWSELIAAAKNLDADHLAGLKAIVDHAAGSGQFPLFAAKLIEAGKNLDGKQLETLRETIFWAKAQDRVRSVEASMDKEVEAFMDKETVSGKSTSKKKGKKKPLEAFKEAIFWGRARDQVRSVEASMDKEMVAGKRALENKRKKKGRKLADGVLART
jgi:transcriptional regulator with XRE-family HTH domain